MNCKEQHSWLAFKKTHERVNKIMGMSVSAYAHDTHDSNFATLIAHFTI